ncbi:AAA family ATPase [Streptomyces sp. DSM 3412]|uniref:AAA family ATPase n=1 Tax=Streptomyces gottesmaniae TaxID=3075518 RepID=A0ABU2Z6T4_9ACTN|nr:AAA family ATPase [Streptomyces sp. DSM 3412]MDT0572300.1 AAA family ATPase [Streptomyces sp. DSM 3412]
MGDMIQLGGQLVEAQQFLPAELLGGDVSNFHLAVKSAQLRSGSRIDFSERGVTVIVGSNNVGKTTLIRELVNRLSAQMGADPNAYKIVESIDLGEQSSTKDLFAWFMVNATYKTEGHQAGFVRGARQNPFNVLSMASVWDSGAIGKDRLWDIASYLVHHSTPFDRMSQVGGAPIRPNFTDPPQQPMHYFQDSEELRQEIDSYSQRVFGEHLTVDYLSANSHFRVGRTAIPAPPIDRVSQEYRRELATLPSLHEQGDGMRSLLGLLIPLVTTPFPIVLVDEPEAFLHPPQAVALGKILGELAERKHMQIILATHDKNLLAGLMGSGAPVSVVRIDRRGDEVRSNQLNNEDLREIWKNPTLKYSNALDGLFHKLVVIAEADPDCRFYAAALEHFLKSSSNTLQLSADDVLFVPSGGLGEMPKLASALRKLSVPVVVSPDMDVFSNQATVRKLIATLGGAWGDFEALDRNLRAPFSSPRSPRTVGAVLNSIQVALQGHENEKYSTNHRKSVEAELHVDSVWREVKRYGLKGFRGQSRLAAIEFMEKASKVGFVPVHAGELESLSDVAVAKGPEWLPAALEARSHESADAQRHVQNILASSLVVMEH